MLTACETDADIVGAVGACVQQRGHGEDPLLRAFGKLGVSDRTAEVTTAIERGDIPPPGR